MEACARHKASSPSGGRRLCARHRLPVAHRSRTWRGWLRWLTCQRAQTRRPSASGWEPGTAWRS
eukprot:4383415-Alexandrium_andersonii.AAC.1